jgi:hypothetical protein
MFRNWDKPEMVVLTCSLQLLPARFRNGNKPPLLRDNVGLFEIRFLWHAIYSS